MPNTLNKMLQPRRPTLNTLLLAEKIGYQGCPPEIIGNFLQECASWPEILAFIYICSYQTLNLVIFAPYAGFVTKDRGVQK